MAAEGGIPFSYEKVVRSDTSTFRFWCLYPLKLREMQNMQKAFVVCFVVLIAVNCVTSRWLPTRSQDDRLEKLREMLKDLLESEIERSNYESKNIFKRDVGTQVEAIQAADSGKNVGMKERLR